jgi:hypothetical protein
MEPLLLSVILVCRAYNILSTWQKVFLFFENSAMEKRVRPLITVANRRRKQAATINQQEKVLSTRSSTLHLFGVQMRPHAQHSFVTRGC